jgi:presqualene diphosphate synthase
MTDLALRTEDQATGAPGRAAGSSFYFAMRILPRPRRDGMFEIYSFCRRVDDIADSAEPRRERLARLARWRAEIDALYAGGGRPEHRRLAQAIAVFGLRKEDFIAVIEGMEMDAAENIRAPDSARLDLYCDRVASAVGRLSVRIFGVGEPDGQLLAHHLGRALQLTNILRDLDEDAAVGRLYLPRELLQDAGISGDDPQAAIAHPGLAAVCAALVRRARDHFLQADAIMDRCPRPTVRAPRIMGKVYQAILDRLVARGWAAPRTPVRIGRLHLFRIVLQYGFV